MQRSVKEALGHLWGFTVVVVGVLIVGGCVVTFVLAVWKLLGMILDFAWS